MVEELDKDYVRTARGLGLPLPRILIRNVLRNGLVAPVTVFGLNIGGLFAGAVLVEAVFRLPGIGSLIVTAVAERDFGIVAAASIIAGIAFVVVNILADMAQAALSPRPVGEL
jgi:peptide/nickel transport system permease protein